MNYYILIILLSLFSFFLIFLFLLKQKIKILEKKIIIQFKEKNNQIPSIYESTKNYLNKHDEIFKEILILKKKDFSENLFYNTLIEKTKTYKQIHNELNFIFRVCNSHPKINKDFKFNLVKSTIINKSSELWDNLMLYKNIVNKYNILIKIKQLTIIWLLIPINQINTI